jgi:hypothetical protein
MTAGKSPKGRPFGEKADYEALRIDGNDLRWHGNKVKTGGWSMGDKIAVASIFVLGSIGIVSNLDKIKPNVCLMHEFSYCQQYKPSPAPVDSKTTNPTNVPKDQPAPIKQQ